MAQVIVSWVHATTGELYAVIEAAGRASAVARGCAIYHVTSLARLASNPAVPRSPGNPAVPRGPSNPARPRYRCDQAA